MDASVVDIALCDAFSSKMAGDQPSTIEVAARLLLTVWSLLNSTSPFETFRLPPLNTINHILIPTGKRVTLAHYELMGRATTRVLAAHYHATTACGRICRSRGRMGEICNAPSTTGDCGRHDRAL